MKATDKRANLPSEGILIECEAIVAVGCGIDRASKAILKSEKLGKTMPRAA